MANIKLKNNYWVTESIYDTTDAKTQKQVNADLYQDIEDLVDDVSNLNGALNNINFANATQVSTSGQDLNNYTSGGVWFFLYASNPSNRPSSANQYGFLAVFNGGNADRITQIWIDTEPAKNNVYIRSRNSTYGWCAWHALYNNAIFKTKNLLLIGDSYNNGNGGTSGRGWGYYLQQLTGCSATIVHQNGGGFAVAGNSNATYPSKTYAQLVSELSASANYDIIVVQSGWNDASKTANTSGASAIATGVSDFITAITTKYPNAEIIILPCYNDTYPLNQEQFRLFTMAKTAAQNGVRTCYDSYFWMQNSGYNATDNIHLNDNGYQMLAKYILAFLRGWDGTVTFEKDITSQVTKPTVTGVTLGNNFHVFVTKDMCHASGDVSLTETVSSWTEIVSGVPSPNLAIITTAFQWQADFKRPMRQGTWGNGLQIRYGESGSYRFDMIYPINHISDTTPG